MPTIRLRALDTLFFRDGKPFSMGDDSFAEGVFPPSPSVIYGALRSAYISQNLDKKSLEELIEESEALEIIDLHYDLDNEDVFPMPLDYVKPKDEEKVAIPLNELYNVVSNSNQNILFGSDRYVEPVRDGLFSLTSMESYLNDDREEHEIYSWNNILEDEEKFGNKRDNSTRGTSGDDGGLYRVSMKRPHKYDKEGYFRELGFIVTYRFIDNDNEKIIPGVIKLGAEGKTVLIEEIEAPISFSTTGEDNNKFKILIQTPTFVTSINKLEKLEEYLKNNGISVKMDASIVGKPVNIGGWDIKEKRPKSMLKAIPAGSIFHYTILTEGKLFSDVDEILTSFKYISEFRNKQGFGLFKLCRKN